MVGDNFDLGTPPTGYEFGPPVLQVDQISVADGTAGFLLVDRLSLDVRPAKSSASTA